MTKTGSTQPGLRKHDPQRLPGRLAIGTIGVTLRSSGTPAIGLGEILVLPGGVAELLDRRRDRRLDGIVFTAILWAVGSLVSDVANGSTSYDLVRGQARVWLTLLTLLGARRIQRSSKLTVWHLVSSYAVGALLAAFLFPAPWFDIDPWKFGLAMPVCILVLGAVRNEGLAVRSLALLGLSALNFGLGYRSVGGVVALVLVIQLFRAATWRHRRGRITGLLVVVVLAVYGLTAAYEKAVYDGVFGDQTEKFETQLDGEIGLLSGRIGTVAALEPIAQRPLIGWGTWADDDVLIATYVRVVVENGGPGFANIQRPDRFPAHSYLLQSWLESGLAAVPFWMLALGLTIRSLRLTLLDRSPPSTWLLLDLLAVKFLWDFLFSPFGAETRGLVVISLLAFLTAIDQCSPRIASTRAPESSTTASAGSKRFDATERSQRASARRHPA